MDGNWDGTIEDNITVNKNLTVREDIEIGGKLI